VKQGTAEKGRAGTALRAHLRVIRALAIGLHPFLPALSDSLWEQLGDARGDEPQQLRPWSEQNPQGQDVWSMGGDLPSIGQLGSPRPVVKKLDADVLLARADGPPDRA
jgi:methionyl-tRNA synthetase